MRRLLSTVLGMLLGLFWSVSGVPSSVALAQGSVLDEVGVAGMPPSLYVKDGFGTFTYYRGQLTGAPAIVSVPDFLTNNPGEPLYIATGTDHQLWVRGKTQDWRHLSTQNTYCIDNPAALVRVVQNGRLLVVGCQGADHALWYSELIPIAPGQIPVMGAFQSLGGVLVSGPAVAVGPDYRTTFFVNGTNGIWTREVDAGHPTSWEPTPWICKGHPGAGAVNKQSYLMTVFACHGTDDGVWQAVAYSNQTGWHDAVSLGGVAVDGVGVAVNPDGVWVYVQGTDSNVYVNRNEVFLVNKSWANTGGIAQFGTGAAALLPWFDQP